MISKNIKKLNVLTFSHFQGFKEAAQHTPCCVT